MQHISRVLANLVPTLLRHRGGSPASAAPRPLVLAGDLQASLREQLVETDAPVEAPGAAATPPFAFELQQPVSWGWRHGWVVARSWDMTEGLAVYDVITPHGQIHRYVRGDALTPRDGMWWGRRAA